VERREMKWDEAVAIFVDKAVEAKAQSLQGGHKFDAIGCDFLAAR
jgi:hypothetical protein